MKTQTYSIVITKDPKVTEKLFYDKLNRKSLTQRMSSLTEEESSESLMISPQRNNNFISFEIDFPASQGQRYCVLKVIESEELLEYFMVPRSGMEEMIKLHARTIQSLRGNAGLVEAASKVKPTFYVTYGMGDDISQWGGPYAVDLIDANLSITSDGVRQLELMFSPTVEGQLVFTNKVFNDTGLTQLGSVFQSSLKHNEKMISRVVSTYDLKKYEDRPSFKPSEEGDKFDKIKFNFYKQSKYLANPKIPGSIFGGFNFVVRDLVKQYLASLFNTPVDNVLFLTDYSYSDLDDAFIQGKIDKGATVDAPAGSVINNDPSKNITNKISFERKHKFNSLINEYGLKYQQESKVTLKTDDKTFEGAGGTKKITGLPGLRNLNVPKFYYKIGDSLAKVAQKAKAFSKNTLSPLAGQVIIAEAAKKSSKIRSLEKEVNQLLWTILTFTKEIKGVAAEIGVRDIYGVDKDGLILSSKSSPNGNRYLFEFQVFGTPPLPLFDRAAFATRDLVMATINDESNFSNDGFLKSQKEALYQISLRKKELDALNEQLRLRTEELLNAPDQPNPDFLGYEPSVGFQKTSAAPYVSNPDKLLETNKEYSNQLKFTIGTYRKPQDVSPSELPFLDPIDKLTRIKERGINDFILVEENNFKIKKLLEKYSLIERADAPVIVFGRQSIVNKLLYPNSLSPIDYNTSYLFYEMRNRFSTSISKSTSDLPVPLPAAIDPVYVRYRDTPSYVGQDFYVNSKSKRLGDGEGDTAAFGVDFVLSKFNQYREDFLKTFDDVIKPTTSSFREPINLGSYYNEVIPIVDKLKGPLIFTHNTPSPNVLDISFDSSPYKGVLLNLGLDSGYSLLDYGLKADQITKDNDFFDGNIKDIIDLLAKEREEYKKDTRSNKPSFISSITKNEELKFKIIDLVLRDDSAAKRPIASPDLEVLQSSRISQMLDWVYLKTAMKPSFFKATSSDKIASETVEILKNISQYIINVRLRTLPFFNVTTIMGRDCYLFGLSNNVIGSDHLRDIPAPAFYSSDYTIIGYKHVISYDSAYSEFELVPGALSEQVVSKDMDLMNFFRITKRDILERRIKNIESRLKDRDAITIKKELEQTLEELKQQL